MRSEFPWDEQRAFRSRIREVAWTSIAIVPLWGWLTLLAIIYLAVFTARDAQVVAVIGLLVNLLLGLGLTYSGRRLMDRGLELKLGGNGNGKPHEEKPAAAGTAQKPPAGV